MLKAIFKLAGSLFGVLIVIVLLLVVGFLLSCIIDAVGISSGSLAALPSGFWLTMLFIAITIVCIILLFKD